MAYWMYIQNSVWQNQVAGDQIHLQPFLRPWRTHRGGEYGYVVFKWNIHGSTGNRVGWGGKGVTLPTPTRPLFAAGFRADTEDVKVYLPTRIFASWKSNAKSLAWIRHKLFLPNSFQLKTTNFSHISLLSLYLLQVKKLKCHSKIHRSLTNKWNGMNQMKTKSKTKRNKTGLAVFSVCEDADR